MDNAEEIYVQEIFNRLAKLQAAVEAFCGECYELTHDYESRSKSADLVCDRDDYNKLKAALEASKGDE